MFWKFAATPSEPKPGSSCGLSAQAIFSLASSNRTVFVCLERTTEVRYVSEYSQLARFEAQACENRADAPATECALAGNRIVRGAWVVELGPTDVGAVFDRAGWGASALVNGGYNLKPASCG